MFLEYVLTPTLGLKYLLYLRRNQWKSLQELRNIQWKKLKSIVRYAYDYTPHYRKVFKSASLKPDDLRSLGDLKKIPITTKKDVQRNYQHLVANGIDLSKCHSFFTSGSTGTPLQIVKDRKALYYEAALKDYAFLECGYRYGDKFIDIGKRSFRHKLKPNKRYVSGLKVSEELNEIVRQIRQVKPDAITTWPWMINALCTVDVHGIEPKLIFSRGETLTQHTRNLVRTKFGIEVNDTYGALEFNRLAFECNEHTGLHMITDCAVLEIIDDGGEPLSPGETGDIIVTGWDNYAMPLIRYEIGDLGVQSDEVCSCGRGWPLIKNVEGKKQDIFTLESGRKLYPRFFYHIIMKNLDENYFCVLELQIVQEERNKILLKFVKGRDFDRKIIESIKEEFDKIFKNINEDVIVEIQIVNEIPLESSSKKKWIISLDK